MCCCLEFAIDEIGMQQTKMYDLFCRSCNPTYLHYVVDSIISRFEKSGKRFPPIDHVVTFKVWESISGTGTDTHIRVILVPESYDSGNFRYKNLGFHFSLELAMNRTIKELTLVCLVK